WKCIGCRYCMVACPFEIPAYEYNNALTPIVQKCDMCISRLDVGKIPACVEICPRNALTFGKRSDLIKVAREKIADNPDKYVNHIYGETELGGTSWLFISCEPFDTLNFPKLEQASVVTLPESIQHGIFKYFIPPAMFYGLLGMIMKLTKSDSETADNTSSSSEVHHD
ncbi:MAG: 4Fe-4S ferredoxin, partial [Candidatus Marinimicrobia bacterium CG_4_9_14_3_um_filter_48_9]